MTGAVLRSHDLGRRSIAGLQPLQELPSWRWSVCVAGGEREGHGNPVIRGNQMKLGVPAAQGLADALSAVFLSVHAIGLHPMLVLSRPRTSTLIRIIRSRCRCSDTQSRILSSSLFHFQYPIISGHDLYAKQPMCRKILKQGADFILRVKTDHHTTLFRCLHGLECPSRKRLEETPGWPNPDRIHAFTWRERRLPLTADKQPQPAYYIELKHIRSDTGNPPPASSSSPH